MNSDIIKWPGGSLDFSSGCLVMGILNVTPDSFSDGGEFLDTAKAVERGLQMAADGASIIDIGAESTRPGSEPTSVEEQIKRVIPVIEKLSKQIEIPISIDSYSHKVTKAALSAGASIVNDITALENDDMLRLIVEREVPVVLMHMHGRPKTMQINPEYADVVGDVLSFLLKHAERAERAGLAGEKIFIDPGIGFGKTLEHNLLLLKHIDKFVSTGYRVLIGTSSKGFIGKITGRQKPSDRIFGTAATVALCAAKAVSIVRVHDVAEMVDVVKMTKALS